MGKDRVEEVDEYKYLGVWINRQATAHNHVEHLVEKASGMHLGRYGRRLQ